MHTNSFKFSYVFLSLIQIQNQSHQERHLNLWAMQFFLTASIQEEVTCCMLFAVDILLVDETRDDKNAKLER